MAAINDKAARVLAIMLLCSASYHFVDVSRAAWSFTTDDAFITLRYAQQWASGAGVVWNRGETPVEGFSNFLFVALSAAILRLGGDPIVVLKLLGCGSAIATAFVLYAGARRLVSPLPAAIPGALYLACPAPQWWSVSGLETTTFALVVACAWWMFATRRFVIAGALVAVAGLIRPEGPIVGIAFVLALTFGRGAWFRPALRLAVGFLPLYTPYLAWRLLYFGHLLPNSVACKSTHAGSPWSLIVDYLPLATLLLAVSAKAWRRFAEPALLACLMVNLLYAVALYGADTTIGYGARHFIAAFALLTVPAAAGVGALRIRSLYVAIGVHTALVGAIVLSNLEGVLESQAHRYARREERRVAVADWLDANLPPGSSYVMGDVGVTGYRTPDLAVVDAYCINNLAMARAAYDDRVPRLVAEVAERRPEAIVVSSRSDSELIPRSEAFTALLSDPEIGTAYEHVATFGGDDAFNYWIYVRSL